MEHENLSNNQPESNKNIRMAIAVAYVLIAILFILVFAFRCNCPMDKGSSADLEKGSIDFVNPKADRDLQDEVNKAVELGMFNAFMNTNIVFEDGDAKGNLLIQNPETNPASVYVEIYTRDTNELIYKSYEIPVGFKIEEAKLNKSLDKGTYKCVAYFNVMEKDGKEVTNRIGLNVDITVKN